MSKKRDKKESQQSKTAAVERRAKAVAEAAKVTEAAEFAKGGLVQSARRRQRPSDVFLGEFRRRDVFPLLILHFCAHEPSYGNHLIVQIEQLTAGIMSVNPNTIYPLLREMEAEGLVEGQWEHPEKRSRRFYSITDAGKAEYERMRDAVRPFLDSVVHGVTLIKQEIYGGD